MALTANLLTIVNVTIWIVCLIFGVALGTWSGRLLGTVLGWLVANSLDQKIQAGGRIGKQFGSFAGFLLGLGAGIYGALQLVALITPTTPH
jgi:hypothetical protein